MLKLRAKDIAILTDPLKQLVAVLALMDPKNRRSLGRSQFVLIRDPGTVAWLRWLLLGLRPEAPLWQWSQQRAVANFGMVIRMCGL